MGSAPRTTPGGGGLCHVFGSGGGVPWNPGAYKITKFIIIIINENKLNGDKKNNQRDK